MSSSRRSFITKTAMAAAIAPFATLSKTYGQGLEQAIDRAPKYSAPTDIRITDVKCAYSGGGLFVKISTNQDIVGWGEAVDAIGGTYHLVQRMGRSLVGRSPLNPNAVFTQFRANPFGGPQGGMFVAVMSAFDAALWDLCGKALGVPVYQLMGGKYRDRVRVYCDTQLYSVRNPTPDVFAKVARTAIDKGYTAVKFDLDEANDPARYDRVNWTASLGEIERMYNSMAAVRKEIGPHLDICCDMHARYDAPTGRKVAKVMEPLNLMWLEEPVPAENVEVYKTISQETSTPICAGENHYLTYGFTRLLSEGAVDLVMPDLQKCGGLGEGLRIANMANSYYTPFSPHMVGSFLAAMSSAHVCAAVPNFHILEWQQAFDTEPRWKDIVKYEGHDKPFIDKGFLTVSNRPGIGVDINEEGLKKYAAQGIPFFA